MAMEKQDEDEKIKDFSRGLLKGNQLFSLSHY